MGVNYRSKKGFVALVEVALLNQCQELIACDWDMGFDHWVDRENMSHPVINNKLENVYWSWDARVDVKFL